MADYALELGASAYFGISSVTSKGTDKLMRKLGEYLDNLEEECVSEDRIRQEVHEFSRKNRLVRNQLQNSDEVNGRDSLAVMVDHES